MGVERALREIEDLFVSGLLWLHDGRFDRFATAGPDPLDRQMSDRPMGVRSPSSAQICR